VNNGMLEAAIAQAYGEVAEGWRDASPNAVSLVMFSEVRKEIRKSPTVSITGKILLPIGLFVGSVLASAGTVILGV